MSYPGSLACCFAELSSIWRPDFCHRDGDSYLRSFDMLWEQPLSTVAMLRANKRGIGRRLTPDELKLAKLLLPTLPRAVHE